MPMSSWRQPKNFVNRLRFGSLRGTLTLSENALRLQEHLPSSYG